MFGIGGGGRRSAVNLADIFIVVLECWSLVFGSVH